MDGTALLQTRLATQLAETQKLLQTNNVMTIILLVKMDAVLHAQLNMDSLALENLQSVLQLVAMN